MKSCWTIWYLISKTPQVFTNWLSSVRVWMVINGCVCEIEQTIRLLLSEHCALLVTAGEKFSCSGWLVVQLCWTEFSIISYPTPWCRPIEHSFVPMPGYTFIGYGYGYWNLSHGFHSSNTFFCVYIYYGHMMPFIQLIHFIFERNWVGISNYFKPFYDGNGFRTEFENG